MSVGVRHTATLFPIKFNHNLYLIVCNRWEGSWFAGTVVFLKLRSSKVALFSQKLFNQNMLCIISDTGTKWHHCQKPKNGERAHSANDTPADITAAKLGKSGGWGQAVSSHN